MPAARLPRSTAQSARSTRGTKACSSCGALVAPRSASRLTVEVCREPGPQGDRAGGHAAPRQTGQLRRHARPREPIDPRAPGQHPLVQRDAHSLTDQHIGKQVQRRRPLRLCHAPMVRRFTASVNVFPFQTRRTRLLVARFVGNVAIPVNGLDDGDMPPDHVADVDALVSATIRGLAAAHRISTAELAAVSGVGVTQFNVKLRGRSSWKLREVAGLAEHFGVTIDDLVQGQVQLTRRRPES